MSPFCTACRSCSCSPSTSGMSFRSVFTYLEARGEETHQSCLPTPHQIRKKGTFAQFSIKVPSSHQIQSKREIRAYMAAAHVGKKLRSETSRKTLERQYKVSIMVELYLPIRIDAGMH